MYTHSCYVQVPPNDLIKAATNSGTNNLQLATATLNVSNSVRSCAHRRIPVLKMVQIVGKYQHVSNENFEEFLNASGHPELAAPILKSKPVVEITNNGDQWNITVTSDNKSSSSSFKLNEPFEEKLPSFDRKFQSLAVLEGNTFKVTTDAGDGTKLIRAYEFTDAGMKVYLSTNKNDMKASRTYKRL